MLLNVTTETLKNEGEYYLNTTFEGDTFAKIYFDKKARVGLDQIKDIYSSCSPAFILGAMLSYLRVKNGFEHWRIVFLRCRAENVFSAYIDYYNKHNPDSVIDSNHPLVRWLDDIPSDRSVFNSEYVFVSTAMKDLMKFYKKFLDLRGSFCGEQDLIDVYVDFAAAAEAQKKTHYEHLLSECKRTAEASLVNHYATWGTW